MRETHRPEFIVGRDSRNRRKSGLQCGEQGSPETAHSKAFLLLAGAMVLAAFGVNCQGTIGLYVSLFYIRGGDREGAT